MLTFHNANQIKSVIQHFYAQERKNILIGLFVQSIEKQDMKMFISLLVVEHVLGTEICISVTYTDCINFFLEQFSVSHTDIQTTLSEEKIRLKFMAN